MVEGVVARGFAGEAAHCWACGWRGQVRVRVRVGGKWGGGGEG